MFSLKQILDSIEDSDYIKNGGKFDLIGFDACLMGNYEVVSILAPYSHYYIGSEELEPGTGWDYYALFSAISKNPDIETKALGKEIVNSYIDQYQYDDQASDSTLSFIDMDKVEALNDALSSFSGKLLKEAEESDRTYYEMLSLIGTNSHFGNRNGVANQGYLALRHALLKTCGRKPVYITEDSAYIFHCLPIMKPTVILGIPQAIM